MVSLENRVRTFIEETGLLAGCETVVIGASGGPDSTALMHLLATLYPGLRYHCVYVNHNLRPEEAGQEQDFVRTQCESLGFNFTIVSIDVLQTAKQNGQSIEECARELRYAALEKIRVRIDGQCIAVGHTSDDQVEQFFIRLFRGSGAVGLSGMRARRDALIRPLLKVAKSDITAYLDALNIDYCTDSSNFSRKQVRNRVRLDLLPTIERDFNASIKQSVLQTMAILQDESDYIDREVDSIYPDIVSLRSFVEGSYTRTELVASANLLTRCHVAVRRRIIEKMCWRMGCTPSFSIIDTMNTLAETGRTGTVSHFGNNLVGIRTHDALLLSSCNPPATARSMRPYVLEEKVVLDGPGRYHVPVLGIDIILTESECSGEIKSEGLAVDADLVTYPLIVRAPASGETLQPLGAPGSKKISRILSDKKIPSHLRYRFPAVATAERVIALLDLVICDDFKLGPETKRSLLMQTEISRPS